MEEVYVGQVTHYFSRIGVAAIELVEPLGMGDTVHIRSPEGRQAQVDFEQRVDSMEIERRPVRSAEAGQEIAIRVLERVRPGDQVYKEVE